MNTDETGRRGEEAAAAYLRNRGFLLLERNWRAGRYEIDLIVQRWDTIHFVEVKTRRAGSLAPPEAAITPAKFRALRRAAEAYLEEHPTPLEVQFDLAAVEVARDGRLTVDYVEHAMECRW